MRAAIDLSRFSPTLHVRGSKWKTLKEYRQARESKSSETIAVGSKRFVEATKDRLGIKAKGRRVLGEDGSYEVREPAAAYGRDFGPKNGSLSLENIYSWNVYPEILMR